MPIVKSYKDPRVAELQGLIDTGMHRRGIKTRRELAKMLRIPESTFSKKYRHPDNFSYGQVKQILDILHIPDEERMRVL